MKKEAKEALPLVVAYECVKCKKRYVVAFPLERLEKQGQGLVSKKFIEWLRSSEAEKYVAGMKARIPGWEAEGWTFINLGLREAFQCEECNFVIDVDEVIEEMSKIARKWETK